MAYLTKQQIQDVISKRPKGTTPETIIAELQKRGNQLEGLNAEQKKAPSTISKIGGVVSRVVQIPQTIATVGAKTLGGVIGGLTSGQGKAGTFVAKDYITDAWGQLKEIPKEVASGYNKGFWSETNMASPSKALELNGALGFAADVAGDPLNLLGIGAARKIILKTAETKTPIMQKIAARMYQSLAKPATKAEAKQIAQIGKSIPQTLGTRLSNYGVSGTFKQMIRKMNKDIPKLSTQLTSAANKITEPIIDTKVILNKVDDLAKNYQAIGKNSVAKAIKSRANLVKQNIVDNKITADEAIKLKRVYDDLRLTASGSLSEAQSAEQRVYKIVSDGLRQQINTVPELGKLNKKMSTYYDAIKSFSKEVVKRENVGMSPVKLSGFFPFFRLNIPTGALPRSFAASMATKLGVPTEKVLKAFTPGILNEIMKNIQK